jgi:hypothetical protein
MFRRTLAHAAVALALSAALPAMAQQKLQIAGNFAKIGRASCRERVS